jgi:hypothetical protein
VPISRHVVEEYSRLTPLRVAVVMALVVSMVGVPPSSAIAANEKPTLLGITSADHRADPTAFTNEAGRPPALYQLFWSLDAYAWPNTWSGGILTDLENRGMVAYVEVTTGNLAALNSGQQDKALNGMAKNVADWIKGSPGRKVIIAPLPEMNLPEHAWSGDPNGYKVAYAHVRQAFLDQGLTKGQIRFVFAPYGVTDSQPLADYYPGDPIVDVVGFAKYNKNSPWQDYYDAFQKHIEGLQTYVSRSKPILITQTGSVDSGGARAGWFDDMFTKLKANDQVIGAIYFNVDKDHDYRVLVNGTLDNAFETGYDQWSAPNEVTWIFDGRMDTWVQQRAEIYASRFIDTWGHTFEGDIEWLADQGITAGCNPPTNNRYCPNDYVTRGAMAAFLVRALGYNNDGGGNHFIDDNGHTFETDIDKLKTAGVTAGCNPPTNNRYCPNDYVTRGAMAAFLVRALGYNNDGGGNHFIDDNGHTFETDIDKLKTAGVTAGCNPPTNNRYCPNDYVTRGAMAAFLHRALGN